MEPVVIIKAKLHDELVANAYVEHGKIIARDIEWTVPHSKIPTDVRVYLMKRWGAPPRGSITFNLSTYHPGERVTEGGLWKTSHDADPIAELRADRDRYEAAQRRSIEMQREEAEQWIVRARGWINLLERDQDEWLGLDWRGPEWRPREIQDRRTTLPPRWVTWVQNHPDLRETLLSVDSAVVAAYEAFQERSKARERAEKDAEKARKQRQQETMRGWIAEHGSDRLRRMIDAGYSGVQQYLHERCTAEYPEFLNVEPDDACAWRTCDSPSAKALDLAQQYGGRVVNLTRWNEQSGDGEAIVVEPDWWDITLLRLIRFKAT